MTEEGKNDAENPPLNDSLRACFIACDHIEKGVDEMLAFCHAVKGDGTVEAQDWAVRACHHGFFAAEFVGALKRALTDLRLEIPEVGK